MHRLLTAVEAELERRRLDAGLEPARAAPVDIASLSSLRASMPDLAMLAARGLRRVASLDGGDVAGAVRGASGFLSRRAELAAQRRRGEASVDDLGFDREWTETLLPLFAWLYRTWWRVRAIGVDNVPSDGGALLVANHAGVLPYDGAMVRTALLLDHPARRHARALVLDRFVELPFTSWLLRRTGNTLAHTGDAQHLLDDDQLVLVFPEGATGTGKSYGDRYRLRRFGRGGFVELAMRTGRPIIPVSIVGSEEIHPKIGEMPLAARVLGLPYVPVTLTFPWLGPAGLVPLPSSWIIEFHTPIDVSADVSRNADPDPRRVLDVADNVRNVIQTGVYTNLERRRSVFALS